MNLLNQKKNTHIRCSRLNGKCVCLILMSVFLSLPIFSAPKPVTKPVPVHKPQIALFDLSDVRLSAGEFKHIMDLDHEYLLTLKPDKLLSWFRREAGLTPKAQPYPFWESEHFNGHGPLAGHILGFYLSSMSMMYSSTGDQRIIDRLNYTIKGMKECQEAQKDGYLLATINGRHVFEDVVDGDFVTSNPFINGTWEPVYIMNKIMLGLYGAHTRCNIPEAKDILIKMADWFGYSVIDKLSHDNMQKLLVCEHGSINESYIQVYTLTGDKKYLDWALRLNDEDMWVPMSEGKDILNGWHANTQIPKFTGFENVYDYSGEKKYTDAARFFWKTVTEKHTWVMGGNSTGEHFFPTDQFERRVVLNGGPESCNSVNMLRLTEALYRDYAEPEKIDYYEKVLFNHILANYDPEEGMCTYYTSMRPGHYRIYSTKYDSFWCCTGTGFESPAKFGQMIYAHDDNNLYINMFIPSQVTWKEKGITLVQETRFPDDEICEFTVNAPKSKRFGIKIRHPYWTTAEKLSIEINGKQTDVSTQGGYVSIDRTWKNGDKIRVALPAKITVEKLIGSDKFLSVKYGPVVLATKVDNFGLKKEDFRHPTQTGAFAQVSQFNTPALIGSLDGITNAITRKPGDKLSFVCSDKAASESFELIPFNRIHFSRYSIYFPYFTDKNVFEKERTAELTRVADYEYEIPADNITVDRVMPGSPESENAHSPEYVNSHSGGNWRDAQNGGYFMFRLKVIPNQKQTLYMAFYGSDAGARVFDVLADGELLETIDHRKPNPKTKGLYGHTIELPEHLVKNKDSITVKFQAKRKNTAGGLFDLRIIKTNNN